MPGVQIPPWLQPPPEAEIFAASARAGAQIAAEQQKLQQQAVMAQMEMQAKQQIAERNAQLDEQQRAVDGAYKQQQIDLHKRELDQAAQTLQEKTQQAAQMFQVKKQYQQRVQAGEDPFHVMLELGPMMGAGTGGEMQAASRISPEILDQFQQRMEQRNQLQADQQTQINARQVNRFAQQDKTAQQKAAAAAAAGPNVSQKVVDEQGNETTLSGKASQVAGAMGTNAPPVLKHIIEQKAKDQIPPAPKDPKYREEGKKYRDPNSGRVGIWHKNGWELVTGE